ncbi:unnamed protein product [Prorocentrum cordatum]|uniref:Uncharacterized protein n=1 Tax=Prorocentrum cordatum TaxID=2364126 RepID=A0ABN9W2U4_9DINO|nr:unnamed protein product [Polarella glacialis]
MPQLQSMVRTTWYGKDSYFYVRGDPSAPQTCALNQVLSQMPPYRMRGPQSAAPVSGAERRLTSSPSLVAHSVELIRVVNTTVGALLNYSAELPIEVSGQLPSIHVNATMNGLACGIVSTSPMDLGKLGQGPTGWYAEATAVDLDVVLGKLWTMQSSQDLELVAQVREGDSLLGDMLAGLRFNLTGPADGAGRRLLGQPEPSGEGSGLDAALEVDSTPEAVLVQGRRLVSMNLGLPVGIGNVTFQLRDHLDRPAASVLLQQTGPLARELAVSYSIRVEGQEQGEAARALLRTLAGRQGGSVGLRDGQIARRDEEFFWEGAGLSSLLDSGCQGQGSAGCAASGPALRDRVACLADRAALPDADVGPACAEALALASAGPFDVLIPST